MIFCSDNQTGASPEVLEMINIANQDYTHGYGDDQWTAQAVDALKTVFDCDLEAFFVSTGTAANALALSCLVHPWEAILCHRQAHILTDESTAPEFFAGGARMVPLAPGEGKITPAHLEAYFQTAGTELPHNPQAKALSVTQASEAGLVYTPDELKALGSVAKDRGVRFHMDGARFANAVAATGCSPAELSWKSGVDVLCLGATKCGCLLAEAVIFFNRDLAATFTHRRKQAGHLLSKGRFLGAQFMGWLRNGHWLDLAGHANAQAALLAEALSSMDRLQLAWPVQSNEIFVVMPRDLSDFLQAAGADFYDWYPEAMPRQMKLKKGDVFARLVTSFATRDQERTAFCELIDTFFSNP